MAYDGDGFGSGTRNVIYDEERIVLFRQKESGIGGNFRFEFTFKSNMMELLKYDSFSFYKNKIHFNKFNRFVENIFNKENIIDRISLLKDKYIKIGGFKI